MPALIKTHSTAECDDRKRKILKLDSHSTRGKQLKALRKILIPPISLEVKKRNGLLEFKKPTGQLLKAVLRAVDDHGATCFASEKTLAQEVNCSERSIRTGLTALEKLGLISLSRRGKQNRYHIVWETIFEILDAQPPMEDESDLELSSETLELSSETLELSSETLELSSDISDVLSDTLNETSSEKKKRASASKPQAASSQHDRFTPPTTGEVAQYWLSASLNGDPAAFHDYYTANGWRVGKTPMKDWQATARNWSRNERSYAKSQPSRPSRVNMSPGSVYDPSLDGVTT